MGKAVFAPAVNAFRFYADDGDEANSSPLANQDTNITVDVTSGDVVLHLRVRIDETGGAGGAGTDDYSLEYSHEGGSFVRLTDGTTHVQWGTSQLTESGPGTNPTTNRATNGISDPGSGSFAAGKQAERGGFDFLARQHLLSADNFTEHVGGVLLKSSVLSDGDTIDFRVTATLASGTLTNNVTPRITVQKPTSISGDLAATEAADAAAVAVAVLVQGDLAATDSADTAAFDVSTLVPIAGDLAATEAAGDAAAFAAQLIVQGDLATGDDADSAAFAGQVAIAGDLAATEAADGLAVAGQVAIAGALAATEAGDSAAFAGSTLAAAVEGDLAATEAPDAAAFAGQVAIAGDLAAGEGADTAAFAAQLIVQGDLAAGEGADSAAFVARLIVQGDLAASEAADRASFFAAPPVTRAHAALHVGLRIGL